MFFQLVSGLMFFLLSWTGHILEIFKTRRPPSHVRIEWQVNELASISDDAPIRESSLGPVRANLSLVSDGEC